MKKPNRFHSLSNKIILLSLGSWILTMIIPLLGHRLSLTFFSQQSTLLSIPLFILVLLALVAFPLILFGATLIIGFVKLVKELVSNARQKKILKHVITISPILAFNLLVFITTSRCAYHWTSEGESIWWIVLFIWIGISLIANPILSILFYLANTKLYKISFFTLGLCVAVIAGFFSGAALSKPVYEENRKRGDLIVKALYKYRDDKGDFPKDLSELEPAYISSLPTTQPGRNFTYSPVKPKDCEQCLTFSHFTLSWPDTYHYYDSEAGKWEYSVPDPW